MCSPSRAWEDCPNSINSIMPNSINSIMLLDGVKCSPGFSICQCHPPYRLRQLCVSESAANVLAIQDATLLLPGRFPKSRLCWHICMSLINDLSSLIAAAGPQKAPSSWALGGGLRYQILSHVFALCASKKTHGHARII